MNWLAAIELLIAGEAIMHADHFCLWQGERGCYQLRLRPNQPALSFRDPYEALDTLVDVLGVAAASQAVAAAHYRSLFPVGSSLAWWQRAL